MNVLIAIDSFKGSLSSVEAGQAAAEGVKKVYSDADIQVVPVADGGEGTVAALVNGKSGETVSVRVSDPLNRKIDCTYGITSKKTAVIEMAAASGLTLLSNEERNPLYTTTYGVGEIIADAIKRGCRNFLIGIGGSATNDGGVGMLTALGFDFLDRNGNRVGFGADALKNIEKISDENVIPELSECTFNIACDVDNPLCGENGCSAVFAPQKGATPESIKDMDLWLSNYAEKVKELYKNSDKNAKGAGAAGGLGFAFMSFLKGRLTSGIELVLNEIDIESKIKNADLVITGEGRLDGQTVMGKTPIGIARVAKKYGKKVIAFSGCVTSEAYKCNRAGIDAFFPILREVCSLEQAMDSQNAYSNMVDTCEQVFRLIKIL